MYQAVANLIGYTGIEIVDKYIVIACVGILLLTLYAFIGVVKWITQIF